MTFYADYTTLQELKTGYLDITATTDDALLMSTIHDVSRQINFAAGRRFAPRYETRTYDTPAGYSLLLDDDLLTVLTLTNGDGSSIAASAYKLLPYNSPVKDHLKLLATSAVGWRTDASGNRDGAITLYGIWGCAIDGRWEEATTLAATITSGATSITVPTGTVKTGWLLRMLTSDAYEYLHVSAVSTGAPHDTLTVSRAANGTTASAHTAGDVIERWQPDYQIEMLCRQAAAAQYRLRANPVGETVVIDGASFATAKDVGAYIRNRLRANGLMRYVTG